MIRQSESLLIRLSALPISGSALHLSLSRTFSISNFEIKSIETKLAVAYEDKPRFTLQIAPQLVILLGDEDQTIFFAFLVLDSSKSVSPLISSTDAVVEQFGAERFYSNAVLHVSFAYAPGGAAIYHSILHTIATLVNPTPPQTDSPLVSPHPSPQQELQQIGEWGEPSHHAFIVTADATATLLKGPSHPPHSAPPTVSDTPAPPKTQTETTDVKSDTPVAQLAEHTNTPHSTERDTQSLLPITFNVTEIVATCGTTKRFVFPLGSSKMSQSIDSKQ